MLVRDATVMGVWGGRGSSEPVKLCRVEHPESVLWVDVCVCVCVCVCVWCVVLCDCAMYHTTVHVDSCQDRQAELTPREVAESHDPLKLIGH